MQKKNVEYAFTFKILGISLLLQALAGCEVSSGQGRDGIDIARLDYNWHIRPILSDNCFGCHGLDEAGREAGLRLDDRASAVSELVESPGKYAIVPGDPEASEVIRRITESDPDLIMPPPSSHKTLSVDEVALLTRWIKEGAEYKRHWAYIAPAVVNPPEIDNVKPATILNDIDRFVDKRLEIAGLAPSPGADRETLINRVSLTLTGLPPTPDQVDDFIKHTGEDSYERLVDRLLASESYGEHMASYWMDLSRWADSDGYLDDNHDRMLWPWRDWVIEAFNSNMPFDQFGTKQLAGDLLPDATRDDLLATTFLRIGKRNTENGAIAEEYEAEYMMDRTETVGTAFLGLTVGCARCHDHRFDPVGIRDYYAMGAFFRSLDEPGVYPRGYSGVQPGPTLLWPNDEQARQLEIAEQELAQAELAYSEVLEIAKANIAGKQHVLMEKPDAVITLIQSSLAHSLDAHFSFENTIPFDEDKLIPQARSQRAPSLVPSTEFIDALCRDCDGDLLVPWDYIIEQTVLSPEQSGKVDAESGKPHYAILQDPILKPGYQGKSLYFDENNKGVLTRGNGVYERSEPFSVDFRFFIAQDYPHNVPFVSNRDNDSSGGKGWRIGRAADGRLWVFIAHSIPANMIALKTVDPVPTGEWLHITLTYDGSSSAAGTTLYLNGEKAEYEVDHDTLTRTIRPTGWVQELGPYYTGANFGIRFREKPPVDSAIDELRFYHKALSPLEVAYLENPELAATKVDSGGPTLVGDILIQANPEVQARYQALTAARSAQNDIVSLIPVVLVAGDAPQPKKAHVLQRGLYSSPGEQVQPQGFDRIFPWDSSLQKNRMGLSRWLFDTQNPLTARVWVNRIWQLHFGRGLVGTSEDFGTQGDNPSHPALLDWLTNYFIESGWDTKALHKLIVMSATYQQDSVISQEQAAIDPNNVFLWRGPSRRMTHEMLRDNALYVSGLLVPKLGGPSLYPYQPEGVWNPAIGVYRYPKPEQVPAEHHHRRSIYSFKKRNALHPGMGNFDAANPNLSAPRRSSSNTPLQALELMNDPQYLEAYRMMAERVIQTSTDLSSQLVLLHRLGARRQPTPDEKALLSDYYSSQFNFFSSVPEQADALLKVGVTEANQDIDHIALAAMTNVAALVMNSPDAYTIR